MIDITIGYEIPAFVGMTENIGETPMAKGEGRKTQKIQNCGQLKLLSGCSHLALKLLFFISETEKRA
jgi:hypothetical protein